MSQTKSTIKLPDYWNEMSKTTQTQWLELQEDDFKKEIDTYTKPVPKSIVFSPLPNRVTSPKYNPTKVPLGEFGLSVLKKAIALAYSHDHVLNSQEILGGSNLTTFEILKKRN